jgi:predicted component of type VI protein secretion system
MEIVSEHREIVGDDAVRVFREEGGTIGRSLNNDWILPDPDRYISGKHAAIDCKGGVYYIADLSTNGIYVNDEKEPVGKGNPRRLFNGDRLFFGDFEIVISIDEGEDLDVPVEPEVTVVPDHIEQLVPEEKLKTGMQLLDEDEMTGDDEFQSVLFGGDEPLVEPDVEEPIEKLSGAFTAEDLMPEISDPRRVEITGQDLFDAFLDGLQISRADFHPSIDLGEAMRNAGEVLREFVVGIEKLLASRADLKSTFSLDQTSILPRRNNPLKMSDNTTDLIKQLMVGGEGEYLGPRDAVREVSQDLLAHQDAFLDAMADAFVEFAERFDPEELEAGFVRSLGRKPMLASLAGSKYWNLYQDLYPILTEKGGGRFPQMFVEEFVKAYEGHIAECLRAHRGGQLPKVKLEPLDEAEYMAKLAETQKLEKPAGERYQDDQADAASEDAPCEVLDGIDIGDELVDFDELEQHLDDETDRAKG